MNVAFWFDLVTLCAFLACVFILASRTLGMGVSRDRKALTFRTLGMGVSRDRKALAFRTLGMGVSRDRKALASETVALAAVLIGLGLFHALSNALQWGGVSTALDPFEDYVQLLEPMLWFAVAYSFLQQQSKAALRESRERLLDLFENAPAAYLAVGADGRVLRCNRRAAELVACDIGRLLGTSVLDLVAGLPAGEADAAQIMERIRAGDAVVDRELEIRRADGSTLWVNLTLDAVRDEQGELQESRVMLVDITARRLAERQQQTLEERLRQSQKLESIGALASGIAHELNNPLTGVINYAQLIHDRIEGRKLKEWASGIVAEGERMAGIVSQLLSFAHRDTGERSIADVRDIVLAALAIVRNVFEADRIRVEKELPEGLPEIRCHSGQIQQVVINLLMNARDALNERYPNGNDGKILRISLEAVEDRAWVRTTIEDHGVGIPREEIDRVFEPFVTTKPRGHGTGLGLAISQGIVADHGGRLSLESEPGAYTRARIDLPAAAEEEEG